MAAGLLLIREAGGFVSDWEGGTDMVGSGSVICGNEHIQKALAEVVKRPVPGK
jgi:myo-inositol-1(or 4)-monophosphatase